MTVTYEKTDVVAYVMDSLTASLRTALQATTRGVPDRFGIVYGPHATEDSKDMAWVRLDRVFPSIEQFGSEDNTRPRRTTPLQWAADVEVGVIRCVTSLQTIGNKAVLPSAADIASDASTLLEDLRALRTAVTFLSSFAKKTLIRPSTAIESGGAAGSALMVSVPFSDCNPTVT